MIKSSNYIKIYVYKMIVVIVPLLIETNTKRRLEGRELFCTLAKYLGQATIISAMRNDIDHEG